MKQERVKDLFDPVMSIENSDIMPTEAGWESDITQPGGGDEGNVPWEH